LRTDLDCSGDSDMDILYVTSLSGDISEGAHQGCVGGLFALKVLGIKRLNTEDES